MIIKGKRAKKFRWFDLPLLFIPALLLIWFLLIGVSDHQDGVEDLTDHNVVVRSLDMETVTDGFFAQDEHRFVGGDHQSDLYARSGEFSVEINKDNIYALEHFYDVSENRRFRLSVWRYSPDGATGLLVATTDDIDMLYKGTQTAVKTEGDWELLSLDLNVPANVSRLKIYCFVEEPGDNSVFFDDLELREVAAVEDYENVELSEVLIEISPTSMLKIESKRDKAWEKGILESDREDWVDARLVYDQESFEAKIRLKGDWLDHLEGDKWSFRIKLQDGAIDGKQVFSVQSPNTRSFLHEWVYHKLLAAEDILTPSYTFVKLKLNGKILGTYAMEEHFMKSLAEHRNRREGPILKLTEDEFWDSIKRVLAQQKEDKYFFDASIGERAFWSSSVESFEEDNALASERLGKQTERAYAMLGAYKYKSAKLSDIFDAERMGKYLAIVDLTQAFHGLAWHNQRWYYNPVADLLEPIGFDGFTEKLLTNSALLAEQAYQEGNYDPCWSLFEDREIMTHYCRFLDTLANTDYIDQFQEEHRGKIMAFQKALRSEYTYQSYDWQRLTRRARQLQVALPPSGQSLRVFTAGAESYSVTNSHILPLEITAYRAQGNLIQTLDSSFFITPTTYNNSTHLIHLPKHTSEVFYQLAGGGERFQATVSPLHVIVPQRHAASLEKVEAAGFEVLGQEIIARSGHLTAPLIVPAGFHLIFPPGTKINLTGSAYLLSYSPVDMLGSEEEPVVIHSEDGTGAVAVLRAGEKSQVSHVRFQQLGSIDDSGYVLTGGVTFYKSPVAISNTSFEDSRQEDALNVVNTTFSLDQCLFAGTAFDALDSDFCQGEISNCHLRDTGNDALDFSGSTVKIGKVTMERIGDKGISAGEHSHIHVQHMDISDAKIGAVSKDLSQLTIEFIRLTNVREAFAAYRKKIDFGPGTLIVHSYEAEGVRHLKMLEEGSTIDLNNPGL